MNQGKYTKYIAYPNRTGLDSGIDADAQTYITAIETAGATVSGTEEAAINQWFLTAKEDSWFSLVPEMWLMTYGLSGPNAIGIKGTVGTFTGGGWTYGSNYVQGNGTTDYFNTTKSAFDYGLTNASAGLAFSSHEHKAYEGIDIGCLQGGGGKIRLSSSSGDTKIYFGVNGDTSKTLSSTITGIIMGNRVGTLNSAHRMFDGTQTSWYPYVTKAAAPGFDATTGNIFCSCMNLSGNIYLPTSRKYNMFAVSKSMTDTQITSHLTATRTLLVALGVPI